MSYPIESFPESKKEFELIENVSSNRGNKLKRGVEYIHRKDMAWTSEGFKPVGSEQSNKTEVKSEFKANALKNVKGNKEGKSSTSSLLTVNAAQPPSSQPKPQDRATPSPYDQNPHTIQQQARNLEIHKKQSISFITSQKTPTENYCKNILSFIQQEFEFRKGLEKLGDFINNKEFDEGSKEVESNEFKRVKRRAMELTEEVNYNTSEFERFLKLSRSRLLKTIGNINDYSPIVIAGGDPEQIKLMEINNGGKKFLDVAGGKYSKNVKNGTNKSRVKPSTSGVAGAGSSGTKPSHGNSKGAGTSNKPKTK